MVEETERGQEGSKEEEEEKEGEEEEKRGKGKKGGKWKERVEHPASYLENTWERGEWTVNVSKN